MKRLTIAVVLLSLSSITSYGQNWPSFRGPNASGVAEGDQSAAHVGCGKVAQRSLEDRDSGSVTRSPIVWGNNIFVQADGHKQSFIAAFNLKDGKQAWRVERNEITSWTTPTIYEGKNRVELIAHGGRYIRGYDPLTGKELWRFADNETQVKMQAPLIAHNLIYRKTRWANL